MSKASRFTISSVIYIIAFVMVTLALVYMSFNCDNYLDDYVHTPLRCRLVGDYPPSALELITEWMIVLTLPFMPAWLFWKYTRKKP
jgi:hypothetical protein